MNWKRVSFCLVLEFNQGESASNPATLSSFEWPNPRILEIWKCFHLGGEWPFLQVILFTLDCTSYDVQFTYIVYTLHCNLYSLLSTVHSESPLQPQASPIIVQIRTNQGTLCTAVQCEVCSVMCALCSLLCAVCCVPCAVCSVPCAVCSLLRAVCRVQCAVCSVHCAVCSVQCVVSICDFIR